VKVGCICRYTYTNWTSLFTREIVADINAFGTHKDKIGLGLDSQWVLLSEHALPYWPARGKHS
jgi:hypothetical protein